MTSVFFINSTIDLLSWSSSNNFVKTAFCIFSSLPPTLLYPLVGWDRAVVLGGKYIAVIHLLLLIKVGCAEALSSNSKASNLCQLRVSWLLEQIDYETSHWIFQHLYPCILLGITHHRYRHSCLTFLKQRVLAALPMNIRGSLCDPVAFEQVVRVTRSFCHFMPGAPFSDRPTSVLSVLASYSRNQFHHSCTLVPMLALPV